LSFDDYPDVEEAFQRFLDESLEPRGPESLFESLSSVELPQAGVAVDVGCGEGRDALELRRRFGLHVHGIDPVQRNVDIAARVAVEARLTADVEFRLGRAEELPFADETADLVWCKEVITFTDLELAFGEFARVLRPNGIAFVYQVLTGPSMSDAEARQFWEVDLGYGDARSVRAGDVEAAAAVAGLVLRRRIDYASEWGEYAQEQSGAGGRRLVHAARLLRDPERYVEAFGRAAYRVMLGDCLWHVYRMIGKLHGVAFIFGKPSA
jgi:SAM-dependent methyltransferase